jgi:hypothetical protein
MVERGDLVQSADIDHESAMAYGISAPAAHATSTRDHLSTATLNATEAAKLFATEKNLPVYGVFPHPLTAIPTAAWMIWQNAFRASPNWRAFAESTDFGLKLCPVANNAARRVALNLAQNRASRI